jgi:hypothetical protein
MTGVPGGDRNRRGALPRTQSAAGTPRPAGRTGPKRPPGLSTGHRGKGQDRDPEHLIAVNRKEPARIERTPPPITHHGARSLEDPLTCISTRVGRRPTMRSAQIARSVTVEGPGQRSDCRP